MDSAFKIIVRFVAGIFISCLIAYSITFVLIEFSDKDPVDTSLRNSDPFFQFDARTYRKQYMDRAELIGYDLPSFYFSWKPRSAKWIDLQKHTSAEKDFYLFWAQYYSDDISFEAFYSRVEEAYKSSKINMDIWSVRTEGELTTRLGPDQFRNQSWMSVPSFEWHGLGNRYHIGALGLLQPNKFKSITSLQPVWGTIQSSLIYTFVLSVSGIVLVLLLSFLIAETLLLKAGVRIKNIVFAIFDIIYSIPVFWLSTLFVLFGTYLASQSWASWMTLPGVFNVRSHTDVWQQIGVNATNLLWPIAVIVLNGLGYMIYYIHSVTKGERKKLYFISFLMKGYSEKEINQLFVRRKVYYSIVSLLPMLLASLVAGSVVLEVIFNIPGMGSLLFRAVTQSDWNIVYAVVVISTSMLWSGYYLSSYLQNKWVGGNER